MIRTASILALLLGIAACAPTAPTAPSRGAWQKPGASEATVAADTEQCRSLAQQAAARDYPYGTTSSPMLSGMVAAHQKTDRDRASAEIEKFNDCMQARGYTR